MSEYSQIGLPQSTTPQPVGGGVDGAVFSVAGKVGTVVLVKGDVGLGNVDNTSDDSKPVSAAAQAALDAKAAASALTAHVAGTNNPHVVTKAQVGLGSVDNTSDAAKPISTATQAALDGKASASIITDHTSNTSNPHGVTKVQVGLGSVDNTTDAAKPISTATQAALDGKAAASHTHAASEISDSTAAGRTLLTAASAAAQKTALSLAKSDVGLGSVDNTSDAAKPVSTATQAALDAKAAVSHTHTASQISDATTAGRSLLTAANAGAQKAALSLAKSDVGLGSVDNTSDAAKPVSTATQAALNLKADAASTVTLTGTETLLHKTLPDVVIGDPDFAGQSLYIAPAFQGDVSSNIDKKLWMMISADGLSWKRMTATDFWSPGHATRDPRLIEWNNKYYVCYTKNGFSGQTVFTVLESSDLISWTVTTDVSCASVTGAVYVWGPKWWVDPLDNSLHVVVAISTTLITGPFVHYELHPTNTALTTWSNPAAITGLPSNTIDGVWVKKPGDANYYFWYKEEATKYIEYATATSLLGPYTVTQSGNWAGWGANLEGTCMMQTSAGTWRLYLDQYTQGGIYYSESTDGWATWSTKALIKVEWMANYPTGSGTAASYTISNAGFLRTQRIATFRSVAAAMMQDPDRKIRGNTTDSVPHIDLSGAKYKADIGVVQGDGSSGLYLAMNMKNVNGAWSVIDTAYNSVGWLHLLENNASGDGWSVYRYSGGFVQVFKVDKNGDATLLRNLTLAAITTSDSITVPNAKYFKWVNGVIQATGTGTPEGTLSAPVGSTFQRSDGGAGTTFYVKEAGSGNTGWVGK